MCYSPSTECYKVMFSSRTHCLRSVLLTSKNVRGTFHFPHISNPIEISSLLSSVPSCLWATRKYDVGPIKDCEPVRLEPTSTYRPRQRQYPLRPEAEVGITPMFDSLLKEGIIVPCDNSPVQTPIFPVKKIRPAGQPTEWRFVQDLQAVNAAINSPTPQVPNPYTILSQIPPDTQWFSVVDLSNAFFSVPVHKDSQFWLAFLF